MAPTSTQTSKPILKPDRRDRPQPKLSELVTVIGEIVPDFIPEIERHHNPTAEPGEIQLCIERDGTLVTQAFFRIGLAFALLRSEVPRWKAALEEQGFRWEIKDLLPILQNDGQKAEDYSLRDRAIIGSILTSNDSLMTLMHAEFIKPREEKK